MLDIYWSFRSPYSYLAIDRLAAIARDFEVDYAFRFVRPLAMREPTFFERNRPQWLPYLFRDVLRESARLGVRFAPPRPDPISMDMASGKVDPEQPLMDRLMGLGVAAEETQKRGLEFARAVSQRVWGGAENWHEGDHLAGAARESGLSLETLEDYARDHASEIADAIGRNEEMQMAHHWGVPLMVLDDEPFFGQDRIDSLIWRLDGKNLRRT
ncbi:MAG: DsbA family protein [Parvularculaceae bacterium]|nr:DsbA family protein [Parvularculaceae bacterium]